MTFESLYTELLSYRLPIIIGVLVAPWITLLICVAIPGKREESFVLSINLGISLLLLIFWIIYLIYAFSGGGVQQIARQADIVLLVLPIYHTAVSLWLSKRRIPLNDIPAFRIMKGLGLMAVSFLALMWVASKIRIVFFSFLPFSTFLYIAGVLVGLGYLGYRYLVGSKK